MQIRVEISEHVDLVEHVPVEVPDDPVQVVAGGGQRGEIGDVPVALGDHDLDERDAIDELGRQDARGRVVAIDAGDPLIRVVLGVLVQEDGLTRLHEVVELVGSPAGEFVDDRAAASPPKRCVQSSSQDIAYMRWMSDRSVSRMRGRWTLTATCSPL